MHTLLITAVALATLGFIVIRPKGLNEGWATAGGAIVMLGLHLVTIRQAIDTLASSVDVLLFLLGLLVLSNLVRDAGFFEWAAILAAETASESGPRLYRNVFLISAVTTTLFSLDTTAVILTPVVVALTRRVRLPSVPFLITCAFVANSGSLLLPVSNLTNLLFVNAFHWHFDEYVSRMLVPQCAVLLMNYFLFKQAYASCIPAHFVLHDLPEPREIVPNLVYYWTTVLVLILVMAGYFFSADLHTPTYAITLVGAATLLLAGLVTKTSGWKAVSDVPWPIFAFVIGLLVVVRAVENTGITQMATQLIQRAGHSSLDLAFVSVFGSAVGANIVNNIPMALLAVSSLGHGAPAIARYGALIGCDVGPNLTVAGSLATMLVITTARQNGENIGAIDFFKIGIKTTPFLLAVAALALWAIFKLH